jgi:PAS domain S-box-containing protein
MYRVMVISKDPSFLDQAERYLCKVSRDMRVVTLKDPAEIDKVLESSQAVDGFICDHDPGKIDAFEVFIGRTRAQDYRPFMITTAEKDADLASRALEMKIDHIVIRDKPPMNLFLEMSSKMIASIESWRVTKEKELNEKRLKALVRLAKMSDCTFPELLHYVLEESVVLTGSKMGYFALYDSNTRILTMHAWSQNGMKACKMSEKPVKYKLDETGVWGEPIRLRQSVIINDYNAASVQGRKGTPVGHVPLNRLLMIPVLHNGEIVGTAGVANKVTEYDDNDNNQLVLLMDSFVSMHLERALKEEASEKEIRLRDVLRNAPVGIIILGLDGGVVECNDFAKRIINPDPVRTISTIDIMTKDSPMAIMIRQLMNEIKIDGKTKEVESAIDSANTRISIRVIASPTADSSGGMSGYIIVVEDITKLVSANKMLESTVNHVNVLDGVIYGGMSRSIKKIKAALANYDANPNTALTLANRGMAEIEEGIEFSKQYRSVGILDLEWQSVREAVEKAIRQSGADTSLFETRVDGLKVLADPALSTMFYHLISNSLQHGMKVTRIKISFKISRGNLTIVYEDNGLGIPDDMKPKLLMREINDTERFGMFLVNSVVSVSNFTIIETGTPGKGVCFEFGVPADRYSID